MLVVHVCFQLGWLNKGFLEISVFCHRARGPVWIGCTLSGHLPWHRLLPIGLLEGKWLASCCWNVVIPKKGGERPHQIFLSVSLLVLLLVFHCSDGELGLVHYFYGRIKIKEKGNKNMNWQEKVLLSLIFYCAADKTSLVWNLFPMGFTWLRIF